MRYLRAYLLLTLHHLDTCDFPGSGFSSIMGTDGPSRGTTHLTKTVHIFDRGTSHTYNREATHSWATRNWAIHTKEGSSKAFRCAFYVLVQRDSEKPLLLCHCKQQ